MLSIRRSLGTGLALVAVLTIAAGCSGVAGPPSVISGSPAPSAQVGAGGTVTVPDALLGTWAADVTGTTAKSGTWLLKAEPGNLSLKNPIGTDFFPLHPTIVSDHELTVPADSECPDQATPTEGRYTYTVDGDTLRFVVISDSCGDRSGLLTVAPWTRQPTAFTSESFDQPFTISLPSGWLVGDQTADMVAFYLPMGPDQAPSQAIDIQHVAQVFKDPCDTRSVEIDPGASPADLATWMGTWAPLHATEPVGARISGLEAITVEEDFDGSPCANANLWPTSGGYLDPAEHKRYSILDVAGKRVVVTLMGRDDTWDATLPEGQELLDSLTFLTP